MTDTADRSTNLDADQMTASATDKSTLSNNGDGVLDAALTEVGSVSVSTTSPLAVSDAMFRRNNKLTLDDAGSPPVADFTIQVSAIKRGLFMVENNTSFVASIEISGQSLATPTVQPGNRALMSCDGSNVSKLQASSITAAAETIDIGSFVTSAPTTDELLLFYVPSVALNLPASFTGSTGYAKDVATAQTDLDVQLNGVSIGTIRFAAATAVPTFINTGADAVAVGDRLEVIAPTVPDATLANFAFTLQAEKA